MATMSHYLQRQSLAFAPGLRLANSGLVGDPVTADTGSTIGRQVLDTGQKAIDTAQTTGQSLAEAAASSPGWTAVTAASIFLSAIHGTRRNNSVVWGVVWGAAAAVAPVIVPAIAVGQGFGKPAGGDGKKKK